MKDQQTHEKPYLWLYWENPQGKETPYYIQLCHQSITRYCKHDFNVVILSGKTVEQYLDDLIPEYNSLFHIAHKADYIRFKLLFKYGGVWLDSDFILFKSLKPILETVNRHDFVCMGYFNQTRKQIFPLIAFLACHPQSKICKAIIEKIEHKIKNEDLELTWDALGGDLLGEFVNESDMYIYDDKTFCPINIQDPVRLFLPPDFHTRIKIRKAFGQALPNSCVGEFIDYLSDSVLKTNTNLSYMLKKSLGINSWIIIKFFKKMFPSLFTFLKRIKHNVLNFKFPKGK